MSKVGLPLCKPKGASSGRLLPSRAFVALLLIGCPPSSQPDADRALEERGAALIADHTPERAQLVSIAERLTARAAQSEPELATRRLTLAAELLARSFRRGHEEADARAAISLYAVLAESEGPEACEASVRRAQLAAEIERDPELLYRELHHAKSKFVDAPCALDLETSLSRLQAFAADAASLQPKNLDTGGRRGGEGVAGGLTEAGREAVTPARAPLEPTGPLRIEAIDPYGSKDRARIVITLNGEARFQTHSLPRSQTAPARIYIDMTDVAADAREIPVGGIVERLRLAPRDATSRLVLDLTAPATHRVFSLPEPSRLVIDVASESTEKPPSPPGAPRPIRRVAIDPGHGGHDPGAVGPSGLREKDVALDIAHRVAPILARELGIITLLTRDDDRFVPLPERTARANAFHADLFISIHCNASESSSARGVATFVFDTTRDENLARIAARENAISLAASLGLDSAGTLGPREVGARSRKLAELLDRATMASLQPKWADTSSFGVKAAGFFVLVGAEMPSVLFETSFISNPVEEARLGTPDYRQKLADAIVNAVKAYREGR